MIIRQDGKKTAIIVLTKKGYRYCSDSCHVNCLGYCAWRKTASVDRSTYRDAGNTIYRYQTRSVMGTLLDLHDGLCHGNQYDRVCVFHFVEFGEERALPRRGVFGRQRVQRQGACVEIACLTLTRAEIPHRLPNPKFYEFFHDIDQGDLLIIDRESAFQGFTA